MVGLNVRRESFWRKGGKMGELFKRGLGGGAGERKERMGGDNVEGGTNLRRVKEGSTFIIAAEEGKGV